MRAELHLVAILVCFVASAFFSGMETGLLCVSHARLLHLIRMGSRAARILNGYLAKMQRFMATTLIGTNLTGVALSTLSAGLSQKCFPGHSGVQTVWAVGAAFMVLFFCEYLPKLLFSTRPLRYTLRGARFFYVVERLLAPLTELVLLLTKWLVPKDHAGSGKRFLMTREYIQHVVSDAKDGSRITAFERLMINRVLALQSQTAVQLMTPLDQVSKTTVSSPLTSCYRLARDSGHVRMPVFSDDGARCLGVLNVLDVVATAPDPERVRARDCMRQPLFVNASERADDVLPVMRRERQPMAMVSAERGGPVLGIITEENILSALIGGLQKTGV